MMVLLSHQLEIIINSVRLTVVIVKHLQVFVIHKVQLLQHLGRLEVHIQPMIFHHFLELLLLYLTFGRVVLQMLIARGLQSLELLTRPLNQILFLACCCILCVREHSLH